MRGEKKDYRVKIKETNPDSQKRFILFKHTVTGP